MSQTPGIPKDIEGMVAATPPAKLPQVRSQLDSASRYRPRKVVEPADVAFGLIDKASQPGDSVERSNAFDEWVDRMFELAARSATFTLPRRQLVGLALMNVRRETDITELSAPQLEALAYLTRLLRENAPARTQFLMAYRKMERAGLVTTLQLADTYTIEEPADDEVDTMLGRIARNEFA